MPPEPQPSRNKPQMVTLRMRREDIEALFDRAYADVSPLRLTDEELERVDRIRVALGEALR